MNIFYTCFYFLQDFWNLLEEFFEHMNPLLTQEYNVNDTIDNDKTK